MVAVVEQSDFGPWNPGIKSELPRAYQHLSTMFRPENVRTSLDEAFELSDFTGLPAHNLVEFQPERLIIHELLIRVMADLSVPDGDEYQDLGINFRSMTDAILSDHITPHFRVLFEQHEALRQEASQLIEAELDATLFASDPHTSVMERSKGKGRFLGSRSRRTVKTSAAIKPKLEPLEALAQWHAALDHAPSSLHSAVLQALIKVVTAIANKRGRLVGEKSVLISLALRFVCNQHGSEVIGQHIEPYFKEAVSQLGYKLLPKQERPVVMNVKGASAAGKSTLRPLQRQLAAKLGIDWRDFALISPDIWRKYLLDYDSLGEAFRYAGTLSGHEVEIIDRKLDRYMASKGMQGEIPHLLIDRFRFDSFVSETDTTVGSNLLTRFGDLVYLYFMITPPDATVQRAWNRGVQLGRYKAVDDLLYHNIEAYEGMPDLFFMWALSENKRVHYEFLDNSVEEGTKPRTVAFGWNGEMNILDVKCLNDIERFRKINVNATCANDVYSDPSILAPEENTAFLQRCAEKIPVINLIDQNTGRIYARFEKAILAKVNATLLAEQMDDNDVRAGFNAIAKSSPVEQDVSTISVESLDRNKAHTLGAWGRTR